VLRCPTSTRFVIGVLWLVAAACTGAHSPDAHITRATPSTRSAQVESAAHHDDEWPAALNDAPGPLTTDQRGTVVIAGDTHVVALDHDGHVQWRTAIANLGIEYPALGDGLVFVSTLPVGRGGAPATGRVVALERATGRERWHIDVYGEPDPVTVTGTTVFVATDRGEMLALALDGTPRWRTRLPGEVSSRTTIAYDRATNVLGIVVLAPHHGWLLALVDARTGTDRGGLELGAGDAPSAVAAAGDGRLVVGDGETAELTEIDLRRRVVAHALRTAGPFDPASQPVVRDGVAYVVDQTGTVTAMDLATGVQKWQTALDTPRVAGIPVAFARDRGRLVVSVRLADPDQVVAVPVL
jgi:outer membrane protein assembly factor BamB